MHFCKAKKFFSKELRKKQLLTTERSDNGLAYIAGPEFIDSTIEKWGTYYPNSNGIPFTIFYKEDDISGSTSISSSVLYAVTIAVADSFNTWMTPWFNDLYFANDPYPPYWTQKGLYLMPPSLLSSQQERPFDFLLDLFRNSLRQLQIVDSRD